MKATLEPEIKHQSKQLESETKHQSKQLESDTKHQSKQLESETKRVPQISLRKHDDPLRHHRP